MDLLLQTIFKEGVVGLLTFSHLG